MSIRPVNIDEFTETSFEDLEATVSPVNWPGSNRQQQLSSTSSPLKNTGGPLSTASSESTTFSNNNKRYSTHTESDEDGSAFLDDFEEFQGKNRDEELLKRHFVQPGLDNYDIRERDGFKDEGEDEDEDEDELQALTQRFAQHMQPSKKNRNLRGITRTRHPFGLPSNKHPQSMLNLRGPSKDRKSSSGQPHELANSRSASSLRAAGRLHSKGIQYKKSMPVLSRYDVIREEDNDRDDYDDAFEDDLKFEKSLLQPQFLSDDEDKSPLNLSPSQYTVTADDSLLTPQLQKRHLEWIRPSQLAMFREPQRHSKTKKRLSANRRLKTIKQEIDHNTPMKKGRMVYNPETLTWEGNEQALSRFRDVDTFDKKAIVIKEKPDLPPPHESKASKRSNSKQHGKVVGRMMFDQENLRWIRIDGNEKDPFGEIPDFNPRMNGNNAFHRGGGVGGELSSKRSQSQFAPSREGGRFTSTATTRFHSLGANPSLHDPTFNVDSKTLERFYHEENRWSKKVGGWFILRDAEMDEYDENQGLPDPKGNSYMYEIRNMVISSARN
ncbi:LAME_0D04786g1_1 [Lachancea meyersii CBS 8951]|uniref:LAME_0D04786g1_1 n=1 Tax=Lachancea meyersii CBS 8951 TaxID=1266667 RepID=A0A1G4J8B0_9SACH|nr:LAME_0D04786g1_1 [Lachancea meyersii CBS 8951]